MKQLVVVFFALFFRILLEDDRKHLQMFLFAIKKKEKLMNYWTNQKEYHIETYVFLRKAIEDSKKMVSRHTQKQPCYNIVLLIMANNWYYIVQI